MSPSTLGSRLDLLTAAGLWARMSQYDWVVSAILSMASLTFPTLFAMSLVPSLGFYMPKRVFLVVSSVALVVTCHDSLLYKGSEDDEGLELEVTG
jgi:hypothetical protein